MQIALELPEDIAQGMQSKWKDLPRAALESLALEAYRSHAITAAQPRQLLAFETLSVLDEAAYRDADAARISYTRTRKVPGIDFGRPVWPGARGSKSGTAR